MRQIILKVPQGNKETIEKALDDHEARNTIFFPNEDHDVFIAYLPNNKIDYFLTDIGEIKQREISIIPRGVITLYPPESEAPDQVADVHIKGPLEIFLGGIQSVGSMFGLFGYSLAAGIIVWIGLFTSTSFLLVAAMLVAPFAGPAMNAALATAAGKVPLLKSSLKRYALAIMTGIVASFVLTLIFPLTTLTPLMEQVSQVSKFALFLPLISGFAGAINICQSERDSLVSGAAVGILVAASLAPPVGLVGAGIYMMDWPVVFSSIFRILLQLLGIHLSATLVFFFYGKVSPNGVRFLTGNKMTGIVTTVLVVLGIGAMMFWQFKQPPFLRKASMNTELAEVLNSELQKLGYIEVLNKEVTFTNTKYKGQSVANFEATILSTDSTLSKEEITKKVIEHLKENLQFRHDNIYRVYQINVVED